MLSEICQVQFHLLSDVLALNVAGRLRVRRHQTKRSGQNGLSAGEALVLVPFGTRIHRNLLPHKRPAPQLSVDSAGL
jgi:hypothetical protein